ncbi:MAG TPA: TolC family protein [Myxococcales bacterium]|nr:TolC family protein [Myxococcales bacterium]
MAAFLALGAVIGPRRAVALDQAPEARQSAPAAAQSPSDRWWLTFESPALVSLVEQALTSNLDLEQRRLQLREARLDPAVPRSWLWPLHLGVQGNVSRDKEYFAVQDVNTSGVFNESDLAVVGTYDIDFAGQRSALRRAADQREAAVRESGESFALSMTAEVATTWFALLEQRSQRALLARQLAEGDGLLSMVQQRVNLALASRLDLLQQRVQVAGNRAQVPQVEARIRMLENRLAALIGQERGHAALPADAVLPPLPSRPDIDVRSLIASRPDVREAEARAKESDERANAQFATWVPTLQAFGRAGFQTYIPKDFFQSPAWAWGVTLAWPVFDGGQRSTETSRLETEARRLRTAEAQIVLQATRDVDDAVAAEQTTTAFLAEIAAQVETGQAALEEAKARYQRGLNDYTPVLTALRILQDAERARLAAQGQLLAVRVRLHEVLPGSWTAATMGER